MNKLDNFIKLLVGNFDNSEQLEKLKVQEVEGFPFAKHINNICNDKIKGLPNNFEGVFLLEESYYTSNGKTTCSPHLFLFTEDGENIKLTSYEIPKGYSKSNFTYDDLEDINFVELNISEKFTPAIYKNIEGIWEGGSVSMFTPILKFTLFERFSEEKLEVSEIIEVNGKRTFGYDEPIIYKRINN
ncbi:hypothetical protein ACHM2J_05790 [Clostridium perfringens]|uniref:hypothetical protein n=1 Tax=Clostridium perfringens TaxID=1502 RepID=UPI00375465F0